MGRSPSTSSGRTVKTASAGSIAYFFDLLLHRLIRLARIAFDVRAPWLGFDRAGGLPDHVELAVGLDLANEHRLVQVVVLLIHLAHHAARRLEGLARHGGDDLVHIGGL